MCSKKSYTSIWYHCTISGWHKLICSEFRGSFSAPPLLQNISTPCLITLLILAPGSADQMLLPWASGVVAGSSTQWHFPIEFPNSGSAAIFAAYHLLMHWGLEGKSRLFLHAACWLLGSFGKLPWCFLWRVRKSHCLLCLQCRKRLSLTCFVITQTVHKCCADWDVLD